MQLYYYQPTESTSPEERFADVKNILENMSEDKQAALAMAGFKDPTITLIISLLGGGLGIDRFYIGDTGLGVTKLLTCGGLGIWSIIDWFLIMGAVREKNFQKLLALA